MATMDRPADDLRRKPGEIGASLHEGEGLVEKAKSMASNVSNAATEAVDKARSVASDVTQAVDKAKTVAGDLSGTASRTYDAGQQVASDIGRTFDAAIKSNPLGVVAAALGIGFIFGRMSR